MKQCAYVIVMLLLCIGDVFGQARQLSGKIMDSDGEALIGANVLVKGTSTGTATDIDGSYQLSVPDDATTLVFSYTGYETVEMPIGVSNVINVTLETAGIALGEVVVTAFGIEREKKEVGYAVTTVDGDAVAQARSSNVLNSLSGRVPGLRTTTASGTAGGSTNILIRGAASLTGNNQPLFVVDGIPISNNNFNGTRNEIIAGGADVGNRASDINPDDIESITVLKGASAVALYGQRAKDGVIQVVTKKGKLGKPTVDFNTTVRASNPMILPKFQNEYASGNFGQYDTDNFTNGWGPPLNSVAGENFKQFPYDGNDRPLQAFPDNVKDFFQTGVTTINNFSVGARNELGDYRISYTFLNEEGIIPENAFQRNNISLNAGTSFSEKIRARTVINYVRSEGKNRPRQGSNSPNLIVSQIYGIPRTTDVELLRNNLLDEDGQTIGVDGNRTGNNPFYILENNPFNNVVDRIFGNVQLNYTPTKWLDFMARAGTDVFRDARRNITSKGTLNALQGQFEDRNIYRREMNLDFIGTVTQELTSDIGLTAFAGFNLNQISTERTRLLSNGLGVSGLYNPANALSSNNERFQSIRRLLGAYFDIGFSYKDFLFLNVTGRNDWSSTLPVENRSFFYPGISTSFIFTDAFDLGGIVSFGKIRASYAQVGSDEAPYQLDFLFTPQSNLFTQFVANNTYPINGQLAFAGPDLLPAGNALVPQDQNTFEIGTELQFLKGRIGFDFTYYNTVTSNQIVSISVAQSTGFDAIRQNVGEISNIGFEALLSIVPVKKGDIEWETTLNFSQNEQKVEKLAEGLDDLALTSGFSGLSVRASPGEAFGLYGAGWKRSPDGDIIINPTTGLRERGPRTRLGDIFPDWQLGIDNRITFKGVTLTGLIDISQGGVLFSRTVSSLRGQGLVEETLQNRGSVFIDQGVLEQTDGGGNTTYVPNNVPVRSMQDFWGNYTNNSNTEGSVFDASYVKLREVTLSYTFPQTLLGNSFIKGLTIGLEGRNLWLIDSEVPHIDPEASFFGPSLQGGAANVEFWSIPTARSFGGNIKLTF